MEHFEKIFVAGVIVIKVNLTRSTLNEAKEFREIEEEINSGHTNLVIDLSKCEIIDSTFFGAIIMALKMMKSKGYKLKVVEPANPGENIFTSINPLGLFDLYKTTEDAIKSSVRDY